MNPSPIDPDVLATAVADALRRVGMSTGAGSPAGGAAQPSVVLHTLHRHWREMDREKPISARYQAWAEAVFGRFSQFMADAYPQTCDVQDVTDLAAKAFLKAEFARGIAPKSYNNALILLRSAFESFGPARRDWANPFAHIKRKRAEMVGRECLTEQEIERILVDARIDDFMRPIVVTALTTGMRRGDCCLLRYGALDLSQRQVRVKTRKAGVYVWLPIFPLLSALLEEALQRRPVWHARDYLFPEQAAMYEKNPDGVTWRFAQLLRRAGVRGEAEQIDPETDGQRLRRPSRRGLHAFRTTWVTLALSHGVPESLVLEVTGIRTLQIAKTHYFSPSAAHYRQALKKLPRILTHGQTAPGAASPKAA